MFGYLAQRNERIAAHGSDLPLTTNVRRYPWRVALSFQRKKGMVALDQIRTIDRRRVVKRFGKATATVIASVKLVIDERLVR